MDDCLNGVPVPEEEEEDGLGIGGTVEAVVGIWLRLGGIVRFCGERV